jgi:hypothetical protein
MWSPEAESRWPGILYVACSRAECEQNIAIDFPISREGLQKVGTLDSWQQQHFQVERLTETATQQRRDAFEIGLGTIENLKQLTLWFADYSTTLLSNPSKTQHLNPSMIQQIAQCISEWKNDAEAED